MASDFLFWLHNLRQDASQNGLSHRVGSRTAAFWFKVYSDGVQPEIRAVIDWARTDPDHWIDLRETETSVDYFQRAA